MMALTEQDREWIKLTSRELTYQVTKDVLEEHIKTCPFGQKQIQIKHIIYGVLIGGSVFGGFSGAGFAIVRALMGL